MRDLMDLKKLTIRDGEVLLSSNVARNLIRMSIYDEHVAATKFTTQFLLKSLV